MTRVFMRAAVAFILAFVASAVLVTVMVAAVEWFHNRRKSRRK